MASVNILHMSNPLFLLAPRRPSQRRLSSPDRDRGRNAGGTQGRAWINGREVGGTEARFAHLAGGHD
jgi:hypothetical protein